MWTCLFPSKQMKRTQQRERYEARERERDTQRERERDVMWEQVTG